MYPRRSSRLPKASKGSPQRSPSPNEEVIRRRLRGKRRRPGLRKTEAGDHTVVDTDEGRGRDIIDIINRTHGAERAAEEEEEGKFVEVADEGVDKSDEDCCSVNSSIASGPSRLYDATPKKPRPSQRLCCSACWKLHQKAKKMKAPIKKKLVDNDPKSLTCDQWVLLKNWRPRRLPNARGKLLTHLQLVKYGAKRAEQRVGEGESSACSRPHPFLQRNLRRRVRVPVKKERKKNGRKRTRDDPRVPRVAKQQRLHSDNLRQHISISSTDDDGLHPTSGHSSSPGFEVCSDQETEESASDTHLTVQVIPSSVTTETTKPREVPPKQKAPKKMGGFRDLLAQLRGNSSVIVREKL